MQRCNPLSDLRSAQPVPSFFFGATGQRQISKAGVQRCRNHDRNLRMSGPGSETSEGRSMQSRTGRNKQSECVSSRVIHSFDRLSWLLAIGRHAVRMPWLLTWSRVKHEELLTPSCHDYRIQLKRRASSRRCRSSKS